MKPSRSRTLFRRRRRIEAMACEDAVALLARYLDDALSPGEWARLENHLAGCGRCSEYLAQIRATIRLASQVPPGDLDPGTRDALTDLYRTWQQP